MSSSSLSLSLRNNVHVNNIVYLDVYFVRSGEEREKRFTLAFIALTITAIRVARGRLNSTLIYFELLNNK